MQTEGLNIDKGNLIIKFEVFLQSGSKTWIHKENYLGRTKAKLSVHPKSNYLRVPCETSVFSQSSPSDSNVHTVLNTTVVSIIPQMSFWLIKQKKNRWEMKLIWGLFFFYTYYKEKLKLHGSSVRSQQCEIQILIISLLSKIIKRIRKYHWLSKLSKQAWIMSCLILYLKCEISQTHLSI